MTPLGSPCEEVVSDTIQQPFRFLDLPPEIRTKVYNLLTLAPTRYICLSDHRIIWETAESSLFDIFPTFPHSLLLTNSQLYHESRSAYFINNTFSITIRRRNIDLEYFLCPSFQDNRRQIRSLRLVIQRWGTKDFFVKSLVPVIEDCILNGRLRSLEILVKDSYSKRFEDLSLHKGAVDGDDSENWKALRRVCGDPYLETLVVKAGPLEVFGDDSDGAEAQHFIDITSCVI